ncbi:hypothetical protein Cus16_2096 [Curtobacterium sp. ER1/6]|nr:hypothetical protein Cus16_2096 [Curtobacterium sp. ER1/6]
MPGYRFATVPAGAAVSKSWRYVCFHVRPFETTLPFGAVVVYAFAGGAADAGAAAVVSATVPAASTATVSAATIEVFMCAPACDRRRWVTSAVWVVVLGSVLPCRLRDGVRQWNRARIAPRAPVWGHSGLRHRR